VTVKDRYSTPTGKNWH